MDNPWVLVLFLSVFHVIGAAVLAHALRDLWQNLRERKPEGCRSVFLIVWATMFGCVPFAFGGGFAGAEDGTWLLVAAQVLAWTSTFLVTLLAREALKEALEPFLHEETRLMLFGGGFLVGGVMVSVFVMREAGFSGLLLGGLFALTGAGIFGYGLWKLWRSTR
jgi:hypothetical protein